MIVQLLALFFRHGEYGAMAGYFGIFARFNEKGQMGGFALLWESGAGHDTNLCLKK